MKCAVHKTCNHIRRRETWYWGGLHGNSTGDCEFNVGEDFETDPSGLIRDDSVEGGYGRSCICTLKILLEKNFKFLLWSFGFATWSFCGIIWCTGCVFSTGEKIYTKTKGRNRILIFFFFSGWWVLFWTCCQLQHCLKEVDISLQRLCCSCSLPSAEHAVTVMGQ